MAGPPGRPMAGIQQLHNSTSQQWGARPKRNPAANSANKAARRAGTLARGMSNPAANSANKATTGAPSSRFHGSTQLAAGGPTAPNATIRKDLQRFAKIRNDSQRFAKIRNDSQRFAKVPKSPSLFLAISCVFGLFSFARICFIRRSRVLYLAYPSQTARTKLYRSQPFATIENH